MKDVGEVLRGLHEEEPFDRLVVAGPHQEAVEFMRHLHPYLAERSSTSRSACRTTSRSRT
jgi:hypothetical protein